MSLQDLEIRPLFQEVIDASKVSPDKLVEISARVLSGRTAARQDAEKLSMDLKSFEKNIEINFGGKIAQGNNAEKRKEIREQLLLSEKVPGTEVPVYYRIQEDLRDARTLRDELDDVWRLLRVVIGYDEEYQQTN